MYHAARTAAVHRLTVGTIKLADVPEYASPAAPPVIAPTGRRRRLNDFPAAPELSAAVLERVVLRAAGGNYARRKLQQQQQQQQQESLLAGEESTAASAASQPLDLVQSGKQQQQQQQRQDPDTQHSGGSFNSRRILQQQQQQQQQGTKQRPGWTGLWWADAGGVGVAVGPSHVLHSVSTVLAVYTVDAASGSQVASKTFALQDLFAPVGAANCR
jgi:hypothetical protein